MPRTPNAVCDVCGKEFYRRPSQALSYENCQCSRKCLGIARRSPDRNCEKCGEPFHPNRKTQRFCSVVCASSVPKPRHGRFKGVSDKSERRLAILKESFAFDRCMVEGCDYKRTFDVHRLVEGKNGGKYEVGNMFAVCPNHHAEIHRGLVDVQKVDDCTLRLTERQANVVVAAASKTEVSSGLLGLRGFKSHSLR